MLTKLRGYAAQDLTNKTQMQKRGLFGYPDNLRQIRDDPTTELDYHQWFAALADEGVNLIRVRLSGKQPDWGDGRVAASLEPPPAGTFNIWHCALDPSNLDQYRVDQVDGSIPPHLWKSSNLGQVIDAAEAHGVKLFLSPFEGVEFSAGGCWARHAWKRGNRYINGVNCQPQDQGFVDHAWQVFASKECRAAAKARLDFILKAVEGRDVVAFWKLCEEMTWLATSHEFWGLDTWDNRMHANVDILVDWVNEMARYLKARHPAPVASGQAFAGTKRSFSNNPNGFDNVINRIHKAEAIDIVTINWYLGENVAAARQWLRTCQDYFEGKQVIVGQYAPWPIPRDEPYTNESEPFLKSKRFEWTAVCGSYGVVGPVRWPGIRERTKNNWLTGGYADPGMMQIAGVTSEFAQYVNLEDWNGTGKCADESISSPGLSLVSSWGDGQHMTMMLTWASGGDKTVTVTGLADQDYTVYLFDWTSGKLINTRDVAASGGKLVIQQVPTQENSIVAYIHRKVPEPLSKITLVFRDTQSGKETPVELVANRSYVLEVSEIKEA